MKTETDLGLCVSDSLLSGSCKYTVEHLVDDYNVANFALSQCNLIRFFNRVEILMG